MIEKYHPLIILFVPLITVSKDKKKRIISENVHFEKWL